MSVPERIWIEWDEFNREWKVYTTDGDEECTGFVRADLLASHADVAQLRDDLAALRAELARLREPQWSQE